MVRLKVIFLIIVIVAMFLFQFLMVRLKADDGERRNNPNRISIPYGSIKSVIPCRISRQ